MFALEIAGLTKRYRNGVHALRGVDLHVEEGDFFALLGPNGAGKSTLIGIVTSLIGKTAGEVSVFDTNIDEDFPKAKSYIGVVPQEINFSQFESVLEIILNQAGYYGVPRSLARERAEIYLRQLGLWSRREQRSRELSGGMKRRLMIARALIHEPRLLILDEPSAGVDIELRRSMWKFLVALNDSGTTIILTTHYLEEAESMCRNIAIIDDGEIIENSDTKSLLARLKSEVFVLDIAAPAPDLANTLFEFRQLDETTLEVCVERGKDLNDVFSVLSQANVRVTSMRNKSNRLEELFMKLLKENER